MTDVTRTHFHKLVDEFEQGVDAAMRGYTRECLTAPDPRCTLFMIVNMISLGSACELLPAAQTCCRKPHPPSLARPVVPFVPPHWLPAWDAVLCCVLVFFGAGVPRT